jgi:hypothetical protein
MVMNANDVVIEIEQETPALVAGLYIVFVQPAVKGCSR